MHEISHSSGNLKLKVEVIPTLVSFTKFLPIPIQDHVPKDELLEYLQLEFVNRTNEVGVDVNRAISCPYSANLVQFVCGLGVRKAAALLKVEGYYLISDIS